MSDIVKTAEQAVHDELWKRASPMVDGKIYESRPMVEVGYPFIDFEDSDTNFRGTKNGLTARVETRINIWDTEDNRRNVSEIGNILFQQAISIRDAYGYPVTLRVNESGIRMMHDSTVTPALWRCIVDLVFEI